MRKQGFYFLFIAVLCTVISCTDHDMDPVSEMDRQFMISAADANLFEIKAGEKAAAKAVLDTVKGYGLHMINDHSGAMMEMKALASKKMVDLPEMLSASKQMKIDTLTMMNGMEFAKTYMKMMVVSHVETIKLFETEIAQGMDPEVKSFAAAKLPALKEHLEKAIALKDSVINL
jgi:putative membrane protein